jgi:hypothetical protein
VYRLGLRRRALVGRSFIRARLGSGECCFVWSGVLKFNW